jgi:hypothetical protein
MNTELYRIKVVSGITTVIASFKNPSKNISALLLISVQKSSGISVSFRRKLRSLSVVGWIIIVPLAVEFSMVLLYIRGAVTDTIHSYIDTIDTRTELFDCGSERAERELWVVSMECQSDWNLEE